MEIFKIRHNWPENDGFFLERNHGAGEYILIHFQNMVTLTVSGHTVTTRPGALIVLSPQTPHSFLSHGPLLHDWMHLLGPVDQEMEKYGLHVNQVYQPSCGQLITSATAFLESEFFAKRPYHKELCESKIREMFIFIARDLNGDIPPPVPEKTADLLRSLRAEMLRFPERAWNNEEIARQVNLSVSRLYPLYRRMFSISPNRDLILMRIEKAKNLLRQGESAGEVAEKLGYASSCHFIRQFRQITGITPGKYGK